MTKTYIFTWAQNKTRAFLPFLRSLRNHPGILQIIQGRYRNPTTPDERPDDWYHPELVPFLVSGTHKPSRNLAIYSDVKIQPTAENPLTGWEVYAGQNSAIFGHPTLAFETKPTATRYPKILITTGAVTVPNYSDSKAGAKGESHHTYGAVIVEVEKDGTYYLRHVTADSKGRFYDLDKRYTPEGVYPAAPALGLVLGDIHSGREDLAVNEATRQLIEQVRPKNLFLHDVLDFDSRSGHHKLQDKVKRATRRVSREVEEAKDTIAWWDGLGPHRTVVVPSNHHDMLNRWLNEYPDPVNHQYWCDLWSRWKGEGDPFAQECKRLGLKGVKFLDGEEDILLGGVSHKFHGHQGVNGSRGNPNQYAKLGVKTSTAHVHAPGRKGGNMRSGVTAVLDHGYNKLPGGWLNAHILQYADGKRTLIVIVKGKYHG